MKAPVTLEPGRVVGLIGPPGSGLTHLALSLMSTRAEMAAYVDVLGWMCPVAAWEAGIEPDRLAVVRCPDRGMWARVVGALIDGVPTVYAEVPAGVGDRVLHRLSALARARGTSVLMRPLRGELPAGVAFTRLAATGIRWEGLSRGHGLLRARQVTLEITGKGIPPEKLEVDGDSLRVVSRLATPRRAAG